MSLIAIPNCCWIIHASGEDFGGIKTEPMGQELWGNSSMSRDDRIKTPSGDAFVRSLRSVFRFEPRLQLQMCVDHDNFGLK